MAGLITIDHATFAPLAQRIQPAGQLQRVWRLPGGMSAEMVALAIANGKGETTNYVIRWYDPTKFAGKTPSLPHEQKVLKLISAAGIKAPRSYLLDSSMSQFPEEYLVITFIEGKMNFAPKNRLRHVGQLADQLAQIHQVKASDYDLGFLATSTQCSEPGSIPNQVNESLRENEIRRRLNQLVWPPSHNEASLLHGDFWPGNSLWHNGELQAVIDWEDARIGDPLSDLAKSRIETILIFGQAALEQFTATYQNLNPIDYTNLPFWDLCAALRFLRLAENNLPGMAAYFHPFGRSDISAGTLHNMFHAFVDAALQKLPK